MRRIQQHTIDVKRLAATSNLRRVGGLVALAAVWFVGVAAFASSAQGWTTTGCKYAGSAPEITYRFFAVDSTYQAAVNQAQFSWDSTAVPGYFVLTGSGDPDINAFDGSYSGGWWAQTSWACSGGLYVGDEVSISMDSTDMAGLTAYEKKLVMIHELGHAYGLGHEMYGCTGSGPAVMTQGEGKFSCSGTAPWSDDQDGVNHVY